ncbi:hypothetical protein [Flavobacterium piscisymbiosum]|uniref:Uncharacterized protein n=1 Tax=Flavobacterium piscisymbiosum TaxID=2893753 RepID=A0ABS8MG61_9FLAO|nr:hypothetical protein [Flavobacterium sp. F-30]MCC9063680.1 hypothetical protein [Flavobacterium sp. F-30]
MVLHQKTLEKLRNLINEEIEYRSGPKLVAFFKQLGFKDSYCDEFPSRWKYTDEKLIKINGTPELQQCIANLFAPINFIENPNKLDHFIDEWTLVNLIEVSCEIGYIKEDVKKFSHSLRDFRNYIHPNEQVKNGFNPDHHTAKISWQVLKVAIQQISHKINNTPPS